LQTFNFAQTNGGLAINGSRTEHNLITIDGAVATRTRANDSQVGVSDMDTVQEMQILTTNYNAEYGRTDGGQIRIVTKSGGRQFHGSAYEYFRNSALNANTWVRNATVGQASISGSPEAFRFNQFGYVFNGPVYIPKRWNTGRNKLFFLWAQEWTRYRQTATATGTVPSDAMRQGDFSELLNPANRLFGRTRTVKDPNGPALFQQRDPERPSEPQRFGAAERVSGCCSGFPAGNGELYCRAAATAEPTPGYHFDRLQSGAEPYFPFSQSAVRIR